MFGRNSRLVTRVTETTVTGLVRSTNGTLVENYFRNRHERYFELRYDVIIISLSKN